MILTVPSSLQTPKISLNSLGEFPFVSLRQKIEILTDQRFGNDIKAPYYHSASSAVLRAFDGTTFDHATIQATIERLRLIAPRSDQHAAKLENNVQMLERFLKLRDGVVPAMGSHGVVRRNAHLVLDGVTISVRPEFITRDPASGLFSLTKLRFSKSKVSADASEIILLVLFKYGQQLAVPGYQLDAENTRLIDCHAGTVIHAHHLPRLRETQLQAALREIHQLWPTLKRPAPRNRIEHGTN